ncbi:MAG TPA: glycosyltransferase family 9 protein [Deltaproteobacteria bacterium]|nr:glycosyltransferase family 9 protein [Deltaproteobacteria bacterium]
MDILIIKLGALGDVVNTLPLAIRLKQHFDARIHWITEPLSFPLLSRHAFIDHAILFDRSLLRKSLPELIRRIRREHFDIALDLQRIAKSALICLASSSRRRIGFDRMRCKEMTWLLPFERIAPSDPSSHMVNQYLEFAEHLGIKREEPQWAVPQGDAPSTELPEKYLVLNIGATKPANRWNAEGFSALADRVMDRYDIPCVLTGGREDRALADGIIRTAKHPVFDLVGRTTIMELTGVLSGARAVVSCDTGPMHLAVALGKEVVALFGPADPKRTGPYRGHVVRMSLPCVPCNRRSCSNPLCMDSILPEDVIEKLDLIMR